MERARSVFALSLLIREGPATELTVATRILSHLGLLGADERIVMLVGSEVVYLAARGVSPSTMTPYDVAALRIGDATVLAGTPPDDAERYVSALRAARGARVAAHARGQMHTAPDLEALVAGLAGRPWSEAEAGARAAGALVGAYPGGEAG